MDQLPNLQEMLNLPKELTFDDVQLAAIDACCDPTRRIVAVTGKAGTGKTALIKEVHKRLTDAGYIVGCSAPTGKAAKRIKESTGIQAQTNHRMLGYGMPVDHEETDEQTGEKKTVKLSTGPSFDRYRPLPYDVILADEYAMVNHEIHRSIIGALKSGARVCMFGDVNQLKPIEESKQLEGQPSPFMVALEKFSGIELTTIHRQQEGSGVAENGARILAGRMPIKRDDFDIQFTNEPVQKLQAFVTKNMELGIDYSSTENQIVTCMNKSWIGTKKLNLSIQSLYWRRELPFLDLPRHKWVAAEEKGAATIRVQVGSKVVYTANTYDLGNEQSVFNGEIGTVVEINQEDGSLDIDLGDRVISVPPLLIIVRSDGSVAESDPRKNVDLAYVLTTHKMQGSECKRVTYIINKSTIYGQSRRNFYTAITRAREHCTVIADQISLAKSTKYAG